MTKLILMGIFCALLAGCQSPDYSEHTETKFHEAKTRVSQLREGMKRAEVEAILKPLPSQTPADDWNVSGYSPTSYQLYPGIWIHVDYLAPRNILLQLPTYLDVNLTRKDKPTREFTRVPLNQIR